VGVVVGRRSVGAKRGRARRRRLKAKARGSTGSDGLNGLERARKVPAPWGARPEASRHEKCAQSLDSPPPFRARSPRRFHGFISISYHSPPASPSGADRT
jgi:hypothetical protein